MERCRAAWRFDSSRAQGGRKIRSWNICFIARLEIWFFIGDSFYSDPIAHRLRLESRCSHCIIIRLCLLSVFLPLRFGRSWEITPPAKSDSAIYFACRSVPPQCRQHFDFGAFRSSIFACKSTASMDNYRLVCFHRQHCPVLTGSAIERHFLARRLCSRRRRGCEVIRKDSWTVHS